MKADRRPIKYRTGFGQARLWIFGKSFAGRPLTLCQPQVRRRAPLIPENVHLRQQFRRMLGNPIISTQVATFSVPEMGQNTQKVATLLTGAVKDTSAGPVRGSECDLVAHLVRTRGSQVQILPLRPALSRFQTPNRHRLRHRNPDRMAPP